MKFKLFLTGALLFSLPAIGANWTDSDVVVPISYNINNTGPEEIVSARTTVLRDAGNNITRVSTRLELKNADGSRIRETKYHSFTVPAKYAGCSILNYDGGYAVTDTMQGGVGGIYTIGCGGTPVTIYSSVSAFDLNTGARLWTRAPEGYYEVNFNDLSGDGVLDISFGTLIGKPSGNIQIDPTLLQSGETMDALVIFYEFETGNFIRSLQGRVAEAK